MQKGPYVFNVYFCSDLVPRVCVPENNNNTQPWNERMLWARCGVYTFIGIKYNRYAFEGYIVEILPVMHHWAALFSTVNVKILFVDTVRQVTHNNRFQCGTGGGGGGGD